MKRRERERKLAMLPNFAPLRVNTSHMSIFDLALTVVPKNAMRVMGCLGKRKMSF